MYLLSLLSNLAFVGLTANPMVFKKPPLQKGALDNGKGTNKKNKLDANLSLFSVAILSQKGVPSINRSQIEAKARSITKTFIMESTCELLPPPLEVKISGLYILLSKTNIIMDKKLLEKPKYIMVLLMKVETYGILSNMFVSAFSQWYIYQPMSIPQFLYFFWFIICSSFI
jgi:hypothetical protein